MTITGTGSSSISQTFTFNVTQPAPMLTNPGTQTAVFGQPVHLQLQYSNINSFSDNGTLPPGLSVSNTGLISGTPTTGDNPSYSVTITGMGASSSVMTTFTYNIRTPAAADTVVLNANGSLEVFVGGVGSPQMLSGPGTIKAISTVQDSSGQTDIFAITTGAGRPVQQHAVGELWWNLVPADQQPLPIPTNKRPPRTQRGRPSFSALPSTALAALPAAAMRCTK